MFGYVPIETGNGDKQEHEAREDPSHGPSGEAGKSFEAVGDLPEKKLENVGFIGASKSEEGQDTCAVNGQWHRQVKPVVARPCPTVSQYQACLQSDLLTDEKHSQNISMIVTPESVTLQGVRLGRGRSRKGRLLATLEPVAEEEMRIDELARRAGTTTRNVRAYQTRGLLPPPKMVGRVGYYGEGHLARLRYIDRLQDRGFSLPAIDDLLKAWEEGRSVSDILGLEEALTAPWSSESAETVSRERLEEMFPEIVENPDLIGQAIELGILKPDGTHYKVMSPRLMSVGVELTSAGVPLSVVLDQHALLASDVQRIAGRFVRLVDEYVWEPFVSSGLESERLPQITQTILRLRPTAFIAVQVLLEQAMENAVALSTERQVSRFFGSGDVPAPGSMDGSVTPKGELPA